MIAEQFSFHVGCTGLGYRSHLFLPDTTYL